MVTNICLKFCEELDKSFLRNSLKNHNINVLIELIENPAEDVKFLNGKDKFEVMAKKNPELHTLKNLFNLDIEF